MLGAQPITNISGDLALSVNGEIYNHLGKSLRTRLFEINFFACMALSLIPFFYQKTFISRPISKIIWIFIFAWYIYSVENFSRFFFWIYFTRHLNKTLYFRIASWTREDKSQCCFHHGFRLRSHFASFQRTWSRIPEKGK